MSTLVTYAGLLLAPSALLAATAYFLRKVFERLLDRDVERFKARLESENHAAKVRLEHELQAKAFMYQTAFSAYHKERADLLAEIYRLVEDLTVQSQTVMGPWRSADFDEAAEFKKLVDDFNTLVGLVGRKRIFLKADTAEMLDRFLKALRGGLYDVDTARRCGPGLEGADFWKKAAEAAGGELPTLRRKLEFDFRETLSGIPNDTLVVATGGALSKE